MSSKPFGSGHFGEWITDEFGLPAYHYTCNQLTDPKAHTPTNELWRSPTEHLHQVGNDRLVGVASNYGHVQVRQDEGSPKFLNDYDPASHQYGGGFGYLTDGKTVLSTYYSGKAESFDRVFGAGYYRKTVKGNGLVVDHAVFAPYGDDPILISKVTIENQREEPADLRWIEYWGCQLYQFSYKAFMRSVVSKKHPNLYRRRLATRFADHISVLSSGRGLEVKKQFMGHALPDMLGWGFLNFMLNFVGKEMTGGPVRSPVKQAVLEDLSPPDVFLVSLDAPCDAVCTNAAGFFGEGGVVSPDGIRGFLSENVEGSGPETGLFLERRAHLKPGESRSMYFAYGYLPEGFTLESLISKYEKDLPQLLSRSCEQWKKNRIQLDVGDEKWVDRELAWHNYYLRSNLTYDSFFREHILSQGHVYQYLIGFQGGARDPLQHALPFVYSDPTIVKEVLRYTLKSMTPDGKIPYGIVGCGMYMPSPFHPSDQEMWLLWLAGEYVLATRDLAFLNEVIPTYPVYGHKARTMRVDDLLSACYRRLVVLTGVGQHGIQRLVKGDWNDMMVMGYVPKEQRPVVEEVGESVLNAAMATYVFDVYSRLLTYAGNKSLAEDVMKHAAAQRSAVQAQWMGKWFKRAWLSEDIGWVGEDNLWLEPQPWAIIGESVDSEQRRILVQWIDKEARKPSKIGAMILGKADPKMVGPTGVGTNAGIWPSINGTLVWALSLVDGKMAWNEWKKNTLATHAEEYPDIWYGIWSGPDTYNSELSVRPGETIFGTEDEIPHETDEEKAKDSDIGKIFEVKWTDFPVMNMHPHAWPLYSVAKLMGTEFTEQGVDLAPSLPKDEYRFTSPLLELEKTKQGYRGRYSPMTAGTWRITLKLGEKERNRVSVLTVNGKDQKLTSEGDKVVLTGASAPDRPLTWSLRF